MRVVKCPCGRDLHYNDPVAEAFVTDLVVRLGPTVNVTVAFPEGPRTFRVSRHFLALHGLKGADLPALGFEEVTEDSCPTSSTPGRGSASL